MDPYSAAIGGVASLGSSLLGGNAAAKAAAEQRKLQREQMAEDKRRFDARKAAYDQMLGRAGDFTSAGESAFLDEAGQAPPELEQMRQDILSGNNEALQQAGNEIQANLAQAGMRGGQAATQLNRGIGSIAQGAIRDINQMAGNEAMQRAAERRAYQSAKAQMGQRAQLTGAQY